MDQLIAIVPVNTSRNAMGSPSRVSEPFGHSTVLGQTLRRIDQMRSVSCIILINSDGEDASRFIDKDLYSTPIEWYACSDAVLDQNISARRVSRQWAANSWRGALAGGTVFDELLPAQPIALAMKHFQAESALLVGGDWPFVDPAICDEIARRHLEHAESMKVVFSQSPPGLSGIAVHRSLIENMAEKHAGFGQVFGYVPSRAQSDPIGLDVCVQIPPAVRQCGQRFIFDTPRSTELMRKIAKRLGDRLDSADVSASVDTASGFTSLLQEQFLPSQVTLELTPQRNVSGPITPHHYREFDRPMIDTELAQRIIEQIGDAGDVNLTLGGLGDALNHTDWSLLVSSAKSADVTSIAIETDLLCDESILNEILDAEIDIVSVRLNADTAACYEKTMGTDSFGQVVENLQTLLKKRAAKTSSDTKHGLPWVIPRLIKTADTLGDMETFFDRWTHFTGHAVIEPAMTGRGQTDALMPAQSPVAMSPPKRFGCRQLAQRMTILSNGFVAMCDQDWHGEDIAGDTRITPLIDIWHAMATKREAHQCGQWNELNLCSGCSEWHRP